MKLKLKDKKAFESCIEETNHFHDGFVKSLKQNNDVMRLQIDGGTWGWKANFVCKGDAKTNIDNDFLQSGIIYDVSMFFEDGKVWWTDASNITTSKKIGDENVYFCAKDVVCEIEK